MMNITKLSLQIPCPTITTTRVLTPHGRDTTFFSSHHRLHYKPSFIKYNMKKSQDRDRDRVIHRRIIIRRASPLENGDGETSGEVFKPGETMMAVAMALCIIGVMLRRHERHTSPVISLLDKLISLAKYHLKEYHTPSGEDGAAMALMDKVKNKERSHETNESGTPIDMKHHPSWKEDNDKLGPHEIYESGLQLIETLIEMRLYETVEVLCNELETLMTSPLEGRVHLWRFIAKLEMAKELWKKHEHTMQERGGEEVLEDHEEPSD